MTPSSNRVSWLMALVRKCCCFGRGHTLHDIFASHCRHSYAFFHLVIQSGQWYLSSTPLAIG